MWNDESGIVFSDLNQFRNTETEKWPSIGEEAAKVMKRFEAALKPFIAKLKV